MTSADGAEASRSGALRVFVAAGDPSGDVHGAMAVQAVRALCPDAWFYGLCGPAMRRAGVAQMVDSAGFSAIGVASALPKVPRLYALYASLKRHLLANHPDVVVLIDFPAFNMRLLRYVHRLGLKSVYYFPPASWRRTPSKPAEVLAELATRVATPFEWSAAVVRELGGAAEWVGHPVLDRYAGRPSEARARGLLSVPLTATPIAVLPGSRRQEIRYILPLLLSALALAEKRIPTILPLVSCGPQADRAALEAIVNRLSPRAIVTEDTIALLSASKAALTKSGTITLDAAVCGVPMVVTYAGSALDHLQYHLFAKGRLKYIAAPNILLDREVVPERIAGMGTPEHLCEALLPLIEEGEPRRAQQAGLAEAVELLGPPGASERVARMILDLAG
ncbi:MAG: hypothetical protein KBA64_04785 [Armatimonadetes bacterium]|jgi:lipid-A-disaccharide synthase|nr:hypothetical protein [Armatimonadota bacterium]